MPIEYNLSHKTIAKVKLLQWLDILAIIYYLKMSGPTFKTSSFLININNSLSLFIVVTNLRGNIERLIK